MNAKMGEPQERYMELSVLPIIAESAEELTEIFKDLHAHPEIGFQETRTSAIVAEKLKSYGVDEVHTDIAKTGVVGIIHGKGKGPRRVGVRADMDALPIHEETNLPYSSKNEGVMHACGHDSHTTMLLGAAKHLAATRDFDGTAVMIFQPAEEGLGGAKGMLEEGLFDKFPCDEIYGMHNYPNGEHAKVGICKGTAMAGASFFDIHIKGKGSHAAMPHQSRDPLVIGSALVNQIQSVVARNVPPLESLVLSVTEFHAGSAYNIVPDTARLAGTIRYFDEEVRDMAIERMQKLCDGTALGFDVEITLEMNNIFDVLVNDDKLSDEYLAAAADIVGEENVSDTDEPATGSEDFSDMLKVVPGAYCRIGHTGTLGLHNPGFFLDPKILPVGASIMARVVERRLAI